MKMILAIFFFSLNSYGHNECQKYVGKWAGTCNYQGQSFKFNLPIENINKCQILKIYNDSYNVDDVTQFTEKTSTQLISRHGILKWVPNLNSENKFLVLNLGILNTFGIGNPERTQTDIHDLSLEIKRTGENLAVQISETTKFYGYDQKVYQCTLQLNQKISVSNSQLVSKLGLSD